MRTVIATPFPLDMPAWYLLRLDPWQLSLKYSNSATEAQMPILKYLLRGIKSFLAKQGIIPMNPHLPIKPTIFIETIWSLESAT